MLLTRAREAARTGERGELIPLAEQDGRCWRAEDIAEGVAILERVLPRGPVGRFQLQAAIAAVHAEAAAYEDTDWEQILVLYEMLERAGAEPGGHAQPRGGRRDGARPRAGPVDRRRPPRATRAMARHHRTHAVRAHLLELAGDPAEAAGEYARPPA